MLVQQVHAPRIDTLTTPLYFIIMELVLSKEQVGNRDAKYEMNLEDSFHCLMKSREMGVEDWRARKYLEMIHWGRDGDDKKRTISAGCKNFEDFQFLMRLLAASGRDEARIVEQNLKIETKSMHCRMLNPISALQDKWNYKGVVAEIERLKGEGWRVRDLVIHSGYIRPEVGWIDEVWEWWDKVHVGLRRVARGGKVKLMFSREVSVGSLDRRCYHPHVHVMYLYKGEDPIERFERFLPDESISPDIAPVKNIDGMTRYFFGVSTPREAYKREWTPEASRKINTSLWEWMDEVKALYYNRKRIGKFGISGKVEKSSLPSVPDQNKIIEDNYAYAKRTRLSNGCGGRASGERESTTQIVIREGMAPESGNGGNHHGGVHQECRGGEPGISSRPEGGNDGRGNNGGSCGRDDEGSRDDLGGIHEGVGEGVKSTHQNSLLREATQSHDKGSKAASPPGSSGQQRIFRKWGKSHNEARLGSEQDDSQDGSGIGCKRSSNRGGSSGNVENGFGELARSAWYGRIGKHAPEQWSTCYAGSGNTSERACVQGQLQQLGRSGSTRESQC